MMPPAGDPEQAAPALSIVVACVGGPNGAERCLEALAPQLDDAEVLVGSPSPVSAELRARHPHVTFHERAGALVPELWRDGIERARGAVVAMTISPMVPSADWAATARAGAERHGVMAGAIDPLIGLTPGDLAECLCRYARDLSPFEARDTPDLPGDNCAYRRELLEQTRAIWADGFWEPEMNHALHGRGVTLRQDPALRVHQGRSAGTAAFVRQRLVHGRANGRQRGAHFSPLRNVAGVLGAPLVPVVLLLRTYRELAARSHVNAPAIRALPWLVAYDVAWAVGEAQGHLDALKRA
jgi:hypothetical protein